MLPNFLICGIQKGGTTALYSYLRQHPDVYMPEVKEVNFFHLNYEKGRLWYEGHFRAATSERAVGEASPLYMWHPEVPQRIAGLIPHTKLIFILRNPIERAYSNYWFNVGRGAQDPRQSFSEAIRTEDGHRRYITKGFYSEQIQRFLRFFGRDQLHVTISEDLRDNPLHQLRFCFEFLGVDSAFEPDTRRLYNPTLVPRTALSKSLFRQWSPIRDHLAPLVPRAVRSLTKGFRVPIYRLLFVSKKPTPMRPEDHQYLRELFYEHNELLASLLERDLALWE